MLAAATLIAVLDSLASQVAKLEDALGLSALSAGTVAGAAAGNRDTLAAIDDATVQQDLTPVFARRAALVTAGVLYGSLQGALLNRALDVHYGGIGGLNRFLSSEGVRVHENLNKIGFQIDSPNVFPPVVDPVARYEGDGAGTGLFVAGSDVDQTKYGDAVLQVVVEVMGNSARTLRLTLKNIDGTTETRDAVIPANAAAASTVAIGAGADQYIGVAGIVTIGGGGTATDRLRVRSVIERNLPAL